jgi:hypothetical protein
MGYLDQPQHLSLLEAASDPYVRAEDDPGDAHRPLVLGHEPLSFVLVGDDVDASPGRHGQKGKKLAGGRRHHDQLLGVEQARVPAEGGV